MFTHYVIACLITAVIVFAITYAFSKHLAHEQAKAVSSAHAVANNAISVMDKAIRGADGVLSSVQKKL